MLCEGQLKSRSHNTRHCLIKVATKAGLTVYFKDSFEVDASNNKMTTQIKTTMYVLLQENMR